jgi:hypothetical protein
MTRFHRPMSHSGFARSTLAAARRVQFERAARSRWAAPSIHAEQA